MRRSDDGTGSFEEHRPLLFSLAYQMLGSVADAEDVVQEAFVRWLGADRLGVRSPRNYLSTTVTRLALDHLRSARVRRESYVGPWLPEPLVGVTTGDPLSSIARAESVTMAFLVLLERLTPPQRAAYLLHDVFGYDYPALAELLETSQPNARQLVHRARRRIADGRPQFGADPDRADDLAERFLQACSDGRMDDLIGMLASDAVAWSDGGGIVSAARRPVVGADRIARFLGILVSKWRVAGEVRPIRVNGGPGLLALVGGKPWAVVSVAADAECIREVFLVVNPDKVRAALRHVALHTPDSKNRT